VTRVGAWLPRAASVAPDRVAVETPRRSVTYAELDRLAALAAARLSGRGAGTGDRVAIALPPGLDFVVALHGCWRLGAVAVPVDVRLGPRERAAQTHGAALVLEEPLDEGSGPTEVALRDEHDLSEVAAVVHTSGSSGAPKPVELTFGNWLWSALGSAAALGLDREERWLCALPLSHVGGLSIVVRSAIYATTAVVHERFEADRVAAAAPRATLVSLVPTMLARVLDAGLSAPGALRCALVGGGPVPPALLERARAAELPLAQTYGLTEACSQVATSPIDEPETAGPPLACTRVEIASDGEIVVSGPTVAPAAGPRLATGDLGALDERGRLIPHGRKSDTIVTGGENVSPAEVEAVLEAHPAVAEAAVHARRDDEWGEAVVAKVVLRPGARADADAIRAHCRAGLAGFKVPKAVEVVAALPRTPAGKLRRGELR
jgi:O-succinylbenzoic acid--CoA ligase